MEAGERGSLGVLELRDLLVYKGQLLRKNNSSTVPQKLTIPSKAIDNPLEKPTSRSEVAHASSSCSNAALMTCLMALLPTSRFLSEATSSGERPCSIPVQSHASMVRFASTQSRISLTPRYRNEVA